MRYEHLSQEPKIFAKVTGLSIAEFDALVADVLPAYVQTEAERLQQRNRQREIGAGRNYHLELRDHILLVVVWLRIYPTGDVLGYLFGVSAPTVSRTQARVLPLLEAAGRDTMRLPDPGRKRRRQLSELLEALPELSLIVDSFEQKVQRPKDRTEAATYYSGKKKTHTLKAQVTVDSDTGYIVDLSPSVPGPMADSKLLAQSGLLETLPQVVGLAGDLAYLNLPSLRQAGFAPRRKPRGQPRPIADTVFNRVFSHFRIIVEHSLGRMRRFQALSQTDRQHRLKHSARTAAVAGLVNRHLRSSGII